MVKSLIEQLNAATLCDAFAVLGPHTVRQGDEITAFLPGATRLWLCDRAGLEVGELACLDASGLFSGLQPVDFDYQFRVQYGDTKVYCEDPYRFPSLLRDADVWLFAEGRHQRSWQFLGAHAEKHQGIDGVQFAVWAPNARRVAVLGDFNHFDARTHVLRFHPQCGIWEMFVPGPGIGCSYCFELIDCNGQRRQKLDPYARALPNPSGNLALVVDEEYTWTDEAFRALPAGHNQPMAIYEVHAGSWRRGDENNSMMSYGELADTLLDYVEDLGFTHIEFLPLTEHPFTGSWGYQPISLFAPTARHGDPGALKTLIDRAHSRGIGVILDWVSAHFPGDEHGLVTFDGTALYEHGDPRQGRHPDWDTLIYNYDRAEVVNYLVSSVRYWIDEFHVDGLRVDAVASMLYLDYSRNPGEWIPNRHGGRQNLGAIELLKRINLMVAESDPHVLMIAEESTAFPGVTRAVSEGGLGFDYKWNMGWMHDTLTYMSREPVHRSHHQNDITFSMAYAYSEHYLLPLSHDEVVHGKGSLLRKMPGDDWQKFANLRLMLAHMWVHPGCKLLFMGCEFGMTSEWNHDGEISWDQLASPAHAGVRRLVKDLNRLYRTLPALHEDDHEPAGFAWLDASDQARSILAFERRTGQGAEPVVVVVNFTPVVRERYEINVAIPGQYQELLNTDSEYYGGSNVGNLGLLASQTIAGRHQLHLTLPPLAAIYLAPVA